MLRDLKIGTKLVCGFASILLIFFAIHLTFTLREAREIREVSARVSQLRVPTVKASTDMARGINAALAALRGWMLLGDPQYKLQRQAAWQEIRLAESVKARLAPRWSDPHNVRRYEEIRSRLNEFERFQGEIEAIVHTPANVPTVQILVDEALPKIKIMAASITGMIDIETTLAITNERKRLLIALLDLRGTNDLLLPVFRAYLFLDEAWLELEHQQQWEKHSGSFLRLHDFIDLLAENPRRSPGRSIEHDPHGYDGEPTYIARQ